MDSQDNPIVSSESQRSHTKLRDLTIDMVGQSIWIRGRLLTGLGNLQQYFFIVHDGHFSVQALVSVGGAVSEEIVRIVAGLPKESTIEVSGVVKLATLEVVCCTQQTIELDVESVLAVDTGRSEVLPILLDAPLSVFAGCAPRRVSFTTLTVDVSRPGDPVLSSPNPDSFGGNDTLLTEKGFSFKKLDHDGFIDHCVKKCKGKFDLKMRSRRNDGTMEDYGFVSTRTSQDEFVPLDRRSSFDTGELEDVCEGQLLIAVRSLLELKSQSNSGKNGFWKEALVKEQLKEIESIFRALGDGWINGTKSRKRNKVIQTLAGPLSTTRQTLNKYFELAFTETVGTIDE